MKNLWWLLFFSFCFFDCKAQPGSLDLSFNTGTGFNGPIGVIIVQPDDKIIAGGSFTDYNGHSCGRIIRLHNDGSIDNTFNTGSGFNQSDIYDIALQPDGKILVSGDFDNYNGMACNSFIRINSNGTYDDSFNFDSGGVSVKDIVVQADGKIIIGGNFQFIDGTPRHALARLNQNGSHDLTFNQGDGFGTFSDIECILLLPDGKIVAAGSFSEIEGNTVSNIARVLADGAWDATFTDGSGFSERVNNMALQPDGKIIAVGQFLYTDSSNYTRFISRITATNGLDSTFHSSTDMDIQTVLIEPDGKILIGGTFMFYNNTYRERICRINSNGEVDSSFAPIVSGFNNEVFALGQQSDGKIIVGGAFTEYDGMIQNHIARLNNSNWNITLEHLGNVSCEENSGYVSVGVYGGVPPYSYEWDTNPVQTGDSAINLNPGFYTVTVTDAENEVTEGTFFVNGPNSFSSTDLAGHFTATTFRPGVESHIFIDVANLGCFPLSGGVKFVLDPLLNYESSIPQPDQIVGDTLIWNLNALTYDSLHFTATVNISTAISAQIGDTVCLSLFVLPVEQDGDNLMSMCYPVVNSYDPNDKQVYPQGTGINGDIINNQKMYYNIRFQNTGTAEAINVYLLDTLDLDLNLQTLQVFGSSHTMVTELLPGNVLKFKFDNIYLPDSNSNEAASHGYVMYEIAQQPNLAIGTQLKNTGYIYFDYNEPIITNTTVNTITEPAGVNEQSFSTNMFYPNPVHDILTIRGDMPTSIKLFNTFGECVAEERNTNQIRVGSFCSGIYLLQLFDKRGGLLKSLKVVKN